MEIVILLIREITFVAGLIIVFLTVTSAMRTFVVPRGENVFLTRLVFQNLRRLFSLRLRWAKTYAVQDRVMAYFAPAGLLLLPLVWLMCITVGYMAMFWALGVESWFDAFLLSGSSLLTLGFAPVDGLAHVIERLVLLFGDHGTVADRLEPSVVFFAACLCAAVDVGRDGDLVVEVGRGQ